jgi:hypothetical protein
LKASCPDMAAKPPRSTALGIGRPICFMAISVAGTLHTCLFGIF